MRLSESDTKIAAELDPSRFSAYLRRTGWVPAATSPAFMARYKKQFPNGDATLLVPITRDILDFKERSCDVVAAIAAVEGRSASDVLSQMSVRSNILSSRLVSHDSKDGTLPLGSAVSIVQSLSSLLVYSLSSELYGAEKSFKRRRKEACSIVAESRFAQTSPGSFVFNILVPVAERKRSGQLSLFGDDVEIAKPPVESRALARIFRGLSDVSNATRGVSDPNEIAANYAEGLNANMCDALIELLDEVSGDCLFSVDFDPEWPAPHGVRRDSAQVSFSSQPALKRASEILRGNSEPQDFYDTVWVYDLHRMLEDESSRRLKLMWSDDSGVQFKAVAFVTQQWYDVAVEAHKLGKELIVKGVMKTYGNRKHIEVEQIVPK